MKKDEEKNRVKKKRTGIKNRTICLIKHSHQITEAKKTYSI